MDRRSVEALSAAVSRMVAVDVWLLADTEEEEERRSKHAASVLRRAGAAVSIIERPLPATLGTAEPASPAPRNAAASRTGGAA